MGPWAHGPKGPWALGPGPRALGPYGDAGTPRTLEILPTPVPTRTWAEISQSWKPLTGILSFLWVSRSWHSTRPLSDPELENLGPCTMGAWAHGSRDPCAQGPMGPRAQGPMGSWAHGPWAHMGPGLGGGLGGTLLDRALLK